METRYWARTVVNILNLSTPAGLLLRLIGGTGMRLGPRGLIVATGYRLPLPVAPAFTVGNVILLRDQGEDLEASPRLLLHEERHATQYVWSLGVVMFPLYLICAAVSLALSGDLASYNPYERLAGLADGGYEFHPLRWLR
jgi:hypothetical protein